MLKGMLGIRRTAAVLSVSAVMLLVMGAGAGAAANVDLSKYSAIGTGQVLNVKLTLPSAVTGALNTVLSAVPISGQTLSLPKTIDESISFSKSVGGMLNTHVSGNSSARMFSGNLDDTVLTPVAKLLRPQGLPIADAVLGGVESATDSLLSIQVPAGTPIIDLGVMKVAAKSTKIADLVAARSDGSTQMLGLQINLTQSAKDTLKQLAAPLLNVTDTPSSGVIPVLNGLLGQVSDALKNSPLNLNVNLQLPTLADLLDRPILSIGKIETSSGTGAAGKVRSASGWSRIVDLNLFGTNASNALVHIDSILAKADASIDGTAGGAVATAVQKIVGLSVINNEISFFNDHLQVLNKRIDLPIKVIDDLTALLGSTLGLNIEVLKTFQHKSAFSSEAISRTLLISLHPQVAGVGELLGLDITTPNATAKAAAGAISPAGGLCVGSECAPTGLADRSYVLAGAILIGLAILGRRYVFAK